MKVTAGQNFALPCLEPSLCLVRMALGTAAVLAGVVGIDFLAAPLAAPEVPAKRLHAAGNNIGDGAPVRGQNPRAVRHKIAFREAAEDVRNLDHGWCPAL